jgi:hypothetical protein
MPKLLLLLQPRLFSANMSNPIAVGGFASDEVFNRQIELKNSPLF